MFISFLSTTIPPPTPLSPSSSSSSSSIPAPLFYNSDSTPDLLVRVNVGEWNTYNYSYVAVLDGRNGDTLWRLYSTQTGMMSSLSLASDHPGGDGLLFISVGSMDKDDPVIKEVD